MERGGGPSYTPDQLPRPLAMSKVPGCTRGMAIGLSGYCTTCAHVASDIPPPIPEMREIGAFLPRSGFEPMTLVLIPLLEQHHLISPPNTCRFWDDWLGGGALTMVSEPGSRVQARSASCTGSRSWLEAGVGP
jgi:hypothetical protein